MWQTLPSVALLTFTAPAGFRNGAAPEFAGLRNRPRGFGCIPSALPHSTPIGDEMAVTAAPSSHVLTQES
jgi:hypothetical protein